MAGRDAHADRSKARARAMHRVRPRVGRSRSASIPSCPERSALAGRGASSRAARGARQHGQFLDGLRPEILAQTLARAGLSRVRRKPRHWSHEMPSPTRPRSGRARALRMRQVLPAMTPSMTSHTRRDRRRAGARFAPHRADGARRRRLDELADGESALRSERRVDRQFGHQGDAEPCDHHLPQGLEAGRPEVLELRGHRHGCTLPAPDRAGSGRPRAAAASGLSDRCTLMVDFSAKG